MHAVHLLAALLCVTLANPAFALFGRNRDPNLDWAALHAKGAEVRNLLWALQSNHAAACGRHVVGQTGFVLNGGEPKWASLRAYYEGLGYQWGNTVVQIAEGSPADMAGLRVGDVITRIDGKRIRERDDMDDAIENSERLHKAEKRRETFVIELERAGQPMQLTLQPRQVCKMRTPFLHHSQLYRAAEGLDGLFALDRDLLAQAGDETDLRILVTHEFAHHLEGHYRRRELIGSVFGVAASVTGTAGLNWGDAVTGLIMSPGDERAADAAAAPLLAAQGIDGGRIAEFWERLRAAVAEGRFPALEAHPVDDERLAHLRGEASPSTTDDSAH